MSDMELNITKLDPKLKDFQSDLELRMENYQRTRNALVGENGSLADFANGHRFFGFHRTEDGWYYREWAPAAEAMFFTGDFNGWDRYSHPMEKKDGGVFEIFLPGRDALKDEQRVMAIVVHNGWELERIPTYANYVVQDQQTTGWSAAIHAREHEFVWEDGQFKPE